MTEFAYENTLSIDELREEIRFEWNQKHALKKALQDLPEIPPTIVLNFLSNAGKWPDDWNKGKELQNKFGLDVIPPKTEYEMAAGLWFRIREGLLKSNG